MKTHLMLLRLCAFVSAALSASVMNKPHGKHQEFSTLLQTLQTMTQTLSDQDVLPTSITFEASSLEQEDEDVSYSQERGSDESGAPILLNEAALAHLLGAEEKLEEGPGDTSFGDSNGDGNEANDRDNSGPDTPEAIDDAQYSDLIPETMDYSPQEEDDRGSEFLEENEAQEGLAEAGQGQIQKLRSISKSHEATDNVELVGVLDVTDQGKRDGDDGTIASPSKGKTKKVMKSQSSKQTLQRQGGVDLTENPEDEPDSGDNTARELIKEKSVKWTLLESRDPSDARVRKDPRPADVWPEAPAEQEAPADPCEGFRCKRGRTCQASEKQPECVCQDPISCPPSVTESEHVCGTDNKTYNSACQLFATKCNLEGSKLGRRLHLDYAGPCKFIASCQDSELQQFPLRMRDWLKNVLLQMYEHDIKFPGFLTLKQRLRLIILSQVQKIYESERRLHAGDHHIDTLARDFEKNYQMYIYPVHWQFAQMDHHPADRYLSHSELAPLRAPLVPVEHCTSRFFQECDSNQDSQVSFREWSQCFGIKEDDMDTNLLF